MIIYKNNKSYITRSDLPNENWTNDSEVYVVDDNSELAIKITKAHPYYEFIVEDGELVDIDTTERPVIITTPQPTLEERLELAEDTINFLLGL